MNTILAKYLNNKNIIYICLAIIVCTFVVNYISIFDFKPTSTATTCITTP